MTNKYCEELFEALTCRGYPLISRWSEFFWTSINNFNGVRRFKSSVVSIEIIVMFKRNCAFWGNASSPTDFCDLLLCVGCVVIWMCTYGYKVWIFVRGSSLRSYSITITISLVKLIASLFMDWELVGYLCDLLEPGLHLTLTLSQMKRWLAAAPGSRSRLCLSWLSLEHKPLYLLDLVEASLKPSQLKGRQKTESPYCSIHLSFISAFFFLVSMIHFLSVCRSVSFPASLHSSELSVSWSVIRVSLPSLWFLSFFPSLTLPESLTLTSATLFFLLFPAQTISMTQPTLQWSH